MSAEQVAILKLVSNGMGMARLESGEVVFVPDALPGETWESTALKKVRGVRTVTAGERIGESDNRMQPTCPHFGSCGGCRLLHIRRDRETALKLETLRDNLRRIAGLADHPVEAVSFPEACSRVRGKLHAEEGIVGFRHVAETRVVPVPGCEVIPRSVTASLDELSRISAEIGFRGEIFFATDTEGAHPAFTFRGELADRAVLPRLKTDLTGVAFESSVGDRLATLGEPRVSYTWNALRVSLAPTQFFQSNPSSWPLFWAWIDRFREQFSPRRVWDVHAGSGFLSSRLSGLEILATEPDPVAFATLEAALGAAGRKARTWLGPAEKAITKKKLAVSACDGLILDPPREGLSKPLRDWLRAEGPAAMLYFSCDVGSFCRDLASLRDHYRLASEVLAMNHNPGTLRLETAVLLQRRT